MSTLDCSASECAPHRVAATYFGHIRFDILAHVPSTAQRVLSVGCGEGRTEAELVARGVDVAGIEINPEAAEAAMKNGVRIVCDDATRTELSDNDDPFDCLIYADVLEHLLDPESILRRHASCLARQGTVIISVPNFRHYSVFSELFVRGNIRYCDAGIFDRTHLRITTRRMVEEWTCKAGLKTVRVEYRILRRRDQVLNFVSGGLLREFLASQVIVVAKSAS